MRFQHFVCLLLAGLAYGQAAPPAPAPATPPAAAATTDQSAAPAAPAPAPEANVGPDDTVITLKGFCTDSSLQGDACKTVITRAQFEKITAALQPNMSPAVRRQAATFYARLLKMSADAEKRGLDKGPMFDQKLAIARMQILSQELTRAMQEDSAKITDADIEEYYKKNEGNFEQATFERIFVPRTKQFDTAAAKSSASSKTGPAAGAKPATKPVTPAQPTEAQTKAAEESMKKLADTLRARAVKGEDPEKLQTEAHVAAGLPGNAPISKMEKVRRTALPQNHQTVMSLNVGEVSEVIADPNGGYYIYKMISKETLPLDTVKPEIKNTMSSQRYRDGMQTFQNPASLDLNDAYFGPVRNSAMPVPPRGVRPVPQPQSQSKDPE